MAAYDEWNATIIVTLLGDSKAEEGKRERIATYRDVPRQTATNRDIPRQTAPYRAIPPLTATNRDKPRQTYRRPAPYQLNDG